MEPMRVPAGATIFSAGDPSLAVYLIEEGEVAITVNSGFEVARLYPGDLFGESGVLETRPRAATATAIAATNLLVTESEAFVHAFGMDNDRALTLVKLLCRRLRSTTLRTIQPLPGATADPQAGVHSAIRLFPDSDRLVGEYAMTPVDVRHLPFQVGNRYGGETLPIASNHSCCIPGAGCDGPGRAALRDPASGRTDRGARPRDDERDDGERRRQRARIDRTRSFRFARGTTKWWPGVLARRFDFGYIWRGGDGDHPAGRA